MAAGFSPFFAFLVEIREYRVDPSQIQEFDWLKMSQSSWSMQRLTVFLIFLVKTWNILIFQDWIFEKFLLFSGRVFTTQVGAPCIDNSSRITARFTSASEHEEDLLESEDPTWLSDKVRD